MSAAVLDRPEVETSRKPERCPLCSGKLRDIGGAGLCTRCYVSYTYPAEATAPPPAPLPVPAKSTTSLTGLKGCRQCGSSYSGDVCFCGAQYNLPVPEHRAEVDIPKLAIDQRKLWCVECRVPRDVRGNRQVCPLCGDAKPLPSREFFREPQAKAEEKAAVKEEPRPNPEQAAPLPAAVTVTAEVKPPEAKPQPAEKPRESREPRGKLGKR